VATCSAGVCQMGSCNPGFVDYDGDPSNGCEYACTPTGPEVCDGVDNDCDKLVDNADPDIIRPSNFCVTRSICAGTTPTCTGVPSDPTVLWRCQYTNPGVETDLDKNLLPQETLCDGFDGDCDNAVDDSFPLKGSGCDDGGLGICKGTGTYVCNAA